MLYHVSEFHPILSLNNNSPWYVHATFCLSIHLVDDSWVFSYLLAIVNTAAMNIGVQVSV